MKKFQIANLENKTLPAGEGDMVLWPMVILGIVVATD